MRQASTCSTTTSSTTSSAKRPTTTSDETVYPVLTPLAFDPGRPFPHISNLSLNLAVVIHDGAEERFARVKIPRALTRLVEVCPPLGAGPACELAHAGEPRGRSYYFVWLEQLVAAHLGSLFPGLEVVESYPFRVTRDAEVEIQELEADDLLESIEEGVRKRRFGTVLRVTITPDMPKGIRKLLMKNLGLVPAEMVDLHPPLGMTDLMQLLKVDRPDLKAPPFVPVVPSRLAPIEEVDVFSAIREGDILLHRPYDSFEPVVQLLKQAAEDPDVLAIKTTLYRVGRDSPVVEALLDAVQNGREVAALVELKARFDEESNIGWARALESEGVHVVYGLLGLKVHSKVTLVVRREAGHIRRYVHVGTGNYNVVTATQYTDLDLLTCDDAIGEDASALFNYLTGYAKEVHYNHFLVAPTGIRSGVEARIRREIEHARAGRPARLLFKLNAVTDPAMIRMLYEASRAGVDVDLLVRGVCCLRPGLPDVSERIRVRAFVGRFLEHSRILWFENGGEPEVLIGSADLMTRNLNRRVEVLTPVIDASVRSRLYEVLDAGFKYDRHSWPLDQHGVYAPLGTVTPGPPSVDPPPGLPPDQQEHFLEQAGAYRRVRDGAADNQEA